MTITIDLAPEEEARLRKRATRQGSDVDGLIRELALREASQEAVSEAQDETPKPGESLAEFLAGYIGVVSSDGSMSARDSEKVFGEGMEEKRKAGNL